MEPAPISLLTVCGLEELSEQAGRRVTHVLSILDPDRPDPDEFGRWGEHRRLLLRFHDAIEPGPGVELPERAHVEAILAFVDEVLAEERTPGLEPHVLIHCHVGVSRSTAAMLMLLARAHPDLDDAELVERLFAIRDKAWPNSRMIAFADEILGRHGGLSEAVRRLHARQIGIRPHLETVMSDLGRAREVRSALGKAAA